MLQGLWQGLSYGLRAFRRNPGGFKFIAVLSLAMGVTRREIGDLDGAMADFNHAIALAPRLAWAYFGRGAILGEQGKFDEAIIDFDRAVELDPEFALAYANRGLARLRRGEDYIAKKDFRLCLKLDPKLKKEIEAISAVMKKRRDHKPGGARRTG
ncbi:MAG TPA: tetratricopeptide repeat protein [Blastocatellia bacterium]|jgi:tetratricopeptide (TPR) repeat protein|nr:tetratricopeptide repeat protein [Blastocatellia bacterium]